VISLFLPVPVPVPVPVVSATPGVDIAQGAADRGLAGHPRIDAQSGSDVAGQVGSPLGYGDQRAGPVSTAHAATARTASSIFVSASSSPATCDNSIGSDWVNVASCA
jgi:hypothetical protein